MYGIFPKIHTQGHSEILKKGAEIYWDRRCSFWENWNSSKNQQFL